MLSPEQIAERAEKYDGRANITEINRLFRRQDESGLWPICGKFNATDRAIRQAQRFVRESGCPLYGLEYALFLDDALSRIVNGEV